MRTLAIVTMIIVLVVACMTACVVLALLIRIQEHDQQIIDLRREKMWRLDGIPDKGTAEVERLLDAWRKGEFWGMPMPV